MTQRGTVIARHVRSQLNSAGYPLIKAEMPNRVAYPEAGIDGLSPTTVDPDVRPPGILPKSFMKS